MKLKSSWFVGAFVIGLIVLSGGLYEAGIVFFNHYQTNQPKASPTVTCSLTGAMHQVNIVKSTVMPQHSVVKLCDKLTITNHDNIVRLIAFGPHEHHVAYDGVLEQVLDQNQSLAITLNQPGNFTFHDHLHDSLIGTFTVIQ